MPGLKLTFGHLKKCGAHCKKALVKVLYPQSIVNSPGTTITQKIKNIVKHELHANTSPFKASTSLSVGVSMAIMPIHGFQVVSLLALTFLLRLNRPLALIGVTVSSAPFLPFWIASGFWVGKLLIPLSTAQMIASLCETILPSKILSFFEIQSVGTFFQSFIQWFLGSIVLSIICGLIVFAAAYPVFRSFKQKKRLCPQQTQIES